MNRNSPDSWACMYEDHKAINIWIYCDFLPRKTGKPNEFLSYFIANILARPTEVVRFKFVTIMNHGESRFRSIAVFKTKGKTAVEHAVIRNYE